MPRDHLPIAFNPAPATVDAVEFIAAAAEPICLSIDKELEDIQAEVKDESHEVFTGTLARDYVRAFNALPPASAMPAPDTVIVFQSPRFATVLVVGFLNGCQLWRGMLPPPHHQAIVAKIKQTI